MTTETTTHTTRDEQRRLDAATVPYALMALGLHMAENHLPLYIGIHTPTKVRRGDAVEIHVAARDLDAWAVTIHLDSVSVTDCDPDALYRHEMRHHGRLPYGGIRVQLLTLHDELPTLRVAS